MKEVTYVKCQDEMASTLKISKNLNKNGLSDITVEDKEKISELDMFLQDIYLTEDVTKLKNRDIKDMISCTLQTESDLYLAKTFSASKIIPKKKSTISLGEIFYGLGKQYNVILRTATYWYSSKKGLSSKPKHISNISLDLDYCFPNNIDIDNTTNEYLLEYLYTQYPFLHTFTPNYIIASGTRGIHIYYCFDENLCPVQNTLEEIVKTLVNILSGDKTKANISNSLRCPNTINLKNGKKSRFIYKNRTKYHFKEFLEDFKFYLESNFQFITEDGEICILPSEEYYYFKEKDEDFIAPSLLSVYNFNDRYKSDTNKKTNRDYLETNRKATKRNYVKRKNKESKNNLQNFYRKAYECTIAYLKNNPGVEYQHRNNFIYVLAVCLKNLHNNIEATLQQLYKINNLYFYNALSLNQINNLVNCVFNHNYHISKEDLRTIISIDEETLCRYNLSTNKEDIKTLKNKNNKKWASLRKKNRNVHNKRLNKVKIIKKFYLKGMSLRNIEKKSHIPKTTISRYVKVFNLEKQKAKMLSKEAFNNLLTMIDNIREYLLNVIDINIIEDKTGTYLDAKPRPELT